MLEYAGRCCNCLLLWWSLRGFLTISWVALLIRMCPSHNSLLHVLRIQLSKYHPASPPLPWSRHWIQCQHRRCSQQTGSFAPVCQLCRGSTAEPALTSSRCPNLHLACAWHSVHTNVPSKLHRCCWGSLGWQLLQAFERYGWQSPTYASMSAWWTDLDNKQFLTWSTPCSYCLLV